VRFWSGLSSFAGTGGGGTTGLPVYVFVLGRSETFAKVHVPASVSDVGDLQNLFQSKFDSLSAISADRFHLLLLPPDTTPDTVASVVTAKTSKKLLDPSATLANAGITQGTRIVVVLPHFQAAYVPAASALGDAQRILARLNDHIPDMTERGKLSFLSDTRFMDIRERIIRSPDLPWKHQEINSVKQRLQAVINTSTRLHSAAGNDLIIDGEITAVGQKATSIRYALYKGSVYCAKVGSDAILRGEREAFAILSHSVLDIPPTLCSMIDF
jgi:hypothetical protein